MSDNQDKEIKKLALQDKISSLVKSESQCSVHFDYKKAHGSSDKVELTVTTLNPSHQEKFVLMKATELGTIKCLEKVLSYLEHHKKYQSSYSVTWSEKTKFQLNVSYFYAYDVHEVLGRFFEGKDKGEFVIYEIKLNPMS